MSNDKPRRVLVLTNTMNVGGAETIIMKIFRSINRNLIVFDFLVNCDGKNFYEDEINDLGGRVFHGVSKSNNFFRCLRVIKKTVKQNKYDVVFKMGEHPLVYFDLWAAKKGGAKKIIARSTNTKAGGKLASFLAFFFRPLLNCITDVKLAPSTEAGIWLFGRKQVSKRKVIILNNGVDTSLFCFSNERRNTIRKEFSIPHDAFVIGHVGRFNVQKNHTFLIDVFAEFLKISQNSYLLLVGEGQLENDIKNSVSCKGITNHVIFAGLRNDIPSLLSAMDAFAFPSFYEGMPNVVIEAQSTGLPCLISNSITKEILLTDLVVQLSLNNKQEWIKSLQGLTKTNSKRDRTLYSLIIDKKGYSIEKSALTIAGIILNDEQ